MAKRHAATQLYNHLRLQKFSHASPNMDCTTLLARNLVLSSGQLPAAIPFDLEYKRQVNAPGSALFLSYALDNV